MANLLDILGSELSARGSITFRRFMEVALYHSQSGYYERPAGGPGRAGDFYTSVNTGSLFGELLACQFSRWSEQISSCRWSLIESGAHRGDLARDILRWMQAHQPEQLARLDFCIVDPSSVRREWQKETLAEFEANVRWSDSLASLGNRAVHGILFSNELLDAMPVHRLGWDSTAKQWFEWGVCKGSVGLEWCRLPMPATLQEEMKAFGLVWPKELLEVLPDNYCLEFCPAAAKWWHEAVGTLAQGMSMTVDYGLDQNQLLVPERPHGTLRAYFKHAIADDILAFPGEQDITAHVNFSCLKSVGEREGLMTKYFGSQASFLTGIIRNEWARLTSGNPWNDSQKRQFQTLTHPEHLGHAFKVLVQERVG